MKTILKNATYELTIKKSRFIGFLFKIENADDTNIYLKKIREEHPNAAHVCYAYSLLNTKKMSDDKEPSGTAGLPILEILNKNELVNVLAIVVRYFGGIKLGSSGLIRAYTNTIRDTLIQTTIKDLNKGYMIELNYDYQDNNLITNILENSHIVEKEFNEQIRVIANVDNNTILKLNKSNFKYEIIKEIYI